MPQSPVYRVLSPRAFGMLSAVLLGTLGCSLTPLAKRTAAFSAAAGKTATSTAAAFSTVERTHFEEHTAGLVLHYDESGFDPKQETTFLRVEDLQARREVLRALLQYAVLLADVSSNRPLEEIDEQAKALGGSVKSFTSDQFASAKLSTAELNGITTAVDALGRALVNGKRGRVLPGILRDMRQPIITICDLLQKDIGDLHDGGLRNQLSNDYTQLINHQQEYIDDNEEKLSPADRRTEIRRLPQLAIAARRDDERLAATAAALGDLAAAHSALADSATAKDAPSFQVRLSALIAEVEQLDDFYNSLPSK